MAQVQLSEQDIDILLEAMGRPSKTRRPGEYFLMERLMKLKAELQAKDAAKEPTR